MIGTFRAWKEGVEDPTQIVKTYSSEFYDVCRRFGWRALVISSHPRVERVTDGQFTVEHRPNRALAARGISYHLRSAWYVLGLIWSAVRFRADVVVASDLTHWYLLSPLPLFGIAVIPALHCTLWPQRARLSWAQSVLRRMDGLLFGRPDVRVMCVSHQVLRQVNGYYRRAHPPELVFGPVYRPGLFPDVDPPTGPPFRVVYAGRIEAHKGVFDLLDVARQLTAAGRDITFDIYGTGGAEADLRRRAAEAGLTGRFRLHGNLAGADLARAYQGGHVIIVPTTVNFSEGLNKVAIEGVLAGRPVVATDVCPAADYLGDAVILAPVGNVRGYARALTDLIGNPDLYRRKRAACSHVAAVFSDPARGWGACLVRAVAAIGSTTSLPDRAGGAWVTSAERNRRGGFHGG
ncbi:MAG: glycosyltransferase family 4 protein [Gemmataceae bacterium]|nr:glycosyltransferase family 4 protein [Gemmataceae bacterium]